ncbi:MAG TPA: hypothetical protein VG889_17565 [Rhizomicrobium sp.]|nr:hypothetical protein [Rhizomicrobium sp.]
MRALLDRLLGRVTGLVYVAQDETGAMKDARPGARLGKTGPPWIVVHAAPDAVLVTHWPGRLWRVRVLRRGREQPLADARYTRADTVEAIEELPCAILFGAHGDAICRVLDAAAALTRDAAERLSAARHPDCDAAYLRVWNGWSGGALASPERPLMIAGRDQPLATGGRKSPVGGTLMTVHGAVGRRAGAIDGAAAFRDEDDDTFLAPPWDGASDALLHAALALGAPELCEPRERDALLAAWEAVYGETGSLSGRPLSTT